MRRLRSHGCGAGRFQVVIVAPRLRFGRVILRRTRTDGGVSSTRIFCMVGSSKIVHTDPEILGGKPVFVGTRVPVKTLYDHLEAGDSFDEFLGNFPSVRREQAVAALEL